MSSTKFGFREKKKRFASAACTLEFSYPFSAGGALFLAFVVDLGVVNVGLIVFGTKIGKQFMYVFLPPGKCCEQTLWPNVGVKFLRDIR